MNESTLRTTIEIVRSMARKRCPHSDPDEFEDTILYNMAKRLSRFVGDRDPSPHLVHYAKMDIIHELRKHIRNADRNFFEVSEYDKVYFDDHTDYSIIDWVNNEAGWDIGTMLYEGYSMGEIAESRGVTLSAICQKRSQMYARARVTGVC